MEAVAALLGVLEAGAAYVPVDPDVPPARAAAQFADASVRVVATTSALAPRLPGMRVVLAEERRAAGAAYEAEPSWADDPGLRALHVRFHGYAQRGRRHAWKSGELRRGDRGELERGTAGATPVRTFATVTALSADLGNTAVFPALCSGGTLHVVPHDVAVDAVRFAAAASAEPFDVLKITPSHLAALLEGGGVGVLPRRILVLGGEPCSWDLVDRIHAAADIHVVNHYGPTEATVGACAYPVGRAGTRAADRAVSAGVPIGRPLANVSCYVRDEHGGLAPLGIPGELFIGGAGTARGYIGRPSLPPSVFRPTRSRAARRVSIVPGDRVRLLASGDLTFLGRLDGQVKVRGYRVELGGDRRGAGRASAVAACAVALHDDALCAYLVLRAGRAGESLAALRARLADRLPEYMLPSALVFLKRLPLGPSGKLDRAALPPPLPAEAACAASCAPRTETEAAVAAIWAEALGRERIGTDETFLGLGGIRFSPFACSGRSVVASGCGYRFGRSSAVRRSAILQQPSTRRGDNNVLFQSESSSVLTFGQELLWLMDRASPGATVWNVHRAFRIRGPLDVPALARAFTELARRHDVLCSTFAETAVGARRLAHPDRSVEIRTIDLSGRRDAASEAELTATLDDVRRTPFDLAAEPPLRVTLVKLAGEDQVLVVDTHHIVSDGWSKSVMLTELSALYAAVRRGEKPALPALPRSYADHAAAERGPEREEAIAEGLAIGVRTWRACVRSALPTDARAEPQRRTPPRKRRSSSRTRSTTQSKRLPSDPPLRRIWCCLRRLRRFCSAAPEATILRSARRAPGVPTARRTG